MSKNPIVCNPPLLYIAWFCAGLFVLVAGEVTARLIGIVPYAPEDYRIDIVPGGQYNYPHPTLGYTHLQRLSPSFVSKAMNSRRSSMTETIGIFYLPITRP